MSWCEYGPPHKGPYDVTGGRLGALHYSAGACRQHANFIRDDVRAITGGPVNITEQEVDDDEDLWALFDAGR